MQPTQIVGLWREDTGIPVHPSLSGEVFLDHPISGKNAILDYLRKGTYVFGIREIRSSNLFGDEILYPASFLSDGYYVWSYHFIVCVDKYNLAIDKEFEIHIRKNLNSKYILNHKDIDRIEQYVFQHFFFKELNKF